MSGKTEAYRICVKRLRGFVKGAVECICPIFAVSKKGAAYRGHVCAYLVCAPGEKFAFDKRKPVMGVERAVTGACGFGARDAGAVKRDLF